MAKLDTSLVDGRVLRSSELPAAFGNRAFLLADGVFESMRFTAGHVPFLSLHVQRLHAALEAHGMIVPESLGEAALRESLEAWRATWGVQGDVRIRLTAYRAGEGAYAPETDDVSWVATAATMTESGFSLPPKGLDVDIFQDMVKHRSPISKFKNLASTVYIRAARHASQRGWGDALVLNPDQRIIESSRSNLFVVSNGVLYTPSLDDGCVGGIMRSVLIRTALDHGVKVYEAALTPQTLLQADELFLTNAVRGIEWVSSYKTKRYFHATAEKLANWIQEDVEAGASSVVGAAKAAGAAGAAVNPA
ncbi:MAG: aminotransferase class IV [Bacteroidetes bacterium]|nr:aminotransferase class IV [Bacteroidota bacterium]